MSQANKTMNPEHPDHPKNVAARARALSTSVNSTPNTEATTGSTDIPDELEANLSASEQSALQAQRQLENPNPETPEKSKTITKEELFVECLTFVSDFANAGNLTGRAMLLYCERAQLIINRYNVAKAVEKKKKVTKK